MKSRVRFVSKRVKKSQCFLEIRETHKYGKIPNSQSKKKESNYWRFKGKSDQSLRSSTAFQLQDL